MNKISGQDIYYAFGNGAVKISRNIQNLNKINFFPVPDGDTGINMATTVNSIVDHVEDKTSVKTVVSGMSKGALMGARGNSGFIFAQFINGFYHQTKTKEFISEKEFIASLRKSVPYVLDAISNPVQGTIITIIDQWTSFLDEHYNKEKNFKKILGLSLKHSKDVLNLTKEELEVLKKNKVVDAGAQGFYHFIEGIVEYFIDGIILKRKNMTRVELIDDYLEEDGNNISEYRYCTEIFFEGQEFHKRELKEIVDSIGDSGILAFNDGQGKVHVHTNDPSLLSKKIYNLGYRIIENKVDDMAFQVKERAQKDNKIALVTDSVADLSKEIIDAYNIHMIPLTITANGSDFLDRVTMNSNMLFELVKQNDTLPKTSMPNLTLVKRLFEQLIEHYEEVIYISLASALSGTHQAIKNLAGEISEDIHVIDSKKNSAAQGLVVLETAKMIKNNLSVEKIKEELPQIIKNTEIYVAVDNFKYMVLGGRVPKTVGKVGTFLNLRPIVSLDENGKGTAFGGSFSRRGAIKKIFKILEEASQKNEIRRVAIAYSSGNLDAEVLANKIENELSIKVDYIKEISNVVAISAGENALAISFTKEVI
jgi:hypothetical protein